MFKNKLLTIIALMAFSSMTFAECNYPKKKFDVPSGKKATEAEMLETMGKVKQFSHTPSYPLPSQAAGEDKGWRHLR